MTEEEDEDTIGLVADEDLLTLNQEAELSNFSAPTRGCVQGFFLKGKKKEEDFFGLIS